MNAPLIVTARFDPASFDHYQALREQHFPAGLNKVPAHISLFHHLPGEELRSVLQSVGEVCASHAPIALPPPTVRSIGRGCAFFFASPELDAVRAALAAHWGPWLTAQDRQSFRAHVTVQNKVDGQTTRRTLEALQLVSPPPSRIVAVDVWHYLGGPWEHAESQVLGAPTAASARREPSA